MDKEFWFHLIATALMHLPQRGVHPISNTVNVIEVNLDGVEVAIQTRDGIVTEVRARDGDWGITHVWSRPALDLKGRWEEYLDAQEASWEATV